MQEFYTLFRELLMEMNRPDYVERLGINEDHRGTKESICGLLETLGFRVTKLVEDRFFFRYLDGTAFLNHFFIKLGFLDGWKSAVNPEDEKEIFAAIEERLNRRAGEEGELKLTIPMLFIQAEKF